jgi:NADP-dependent 3-hydroxy acid dehydrogenase YdfG
VYATDILSSNLDDLRRVGCRCLELDVTDPQAVKAAVSQTMAEAGMIDMLINCAGVMVQGSVLDTPPDASQQCLDVNVLGPVRVMQAVIPYMMQQHCGTIVNIGEGWCYSHWQHT